MASYSRQGDDVAAHTNLAYLTRQIISSHDTAQCHLGHTPIQTNHNTLPMSLLLNINLVPPNLLHRSRREMRHIQQRRQLRITNEHDIPRHIPTQTLSARRARQAALVGPELVEVVDRIKRQLRVRRRVDAFLAVPV